MWDFGVGGLGIPSSISALSIKVSRVLATLITCFEYCNTARIPLFHASGLNEATVLPTFQKFQGEHFRSDHRPYSVVGKTLESLIGSWILDLGSWILAGSWSEDLFGPRKELEGQKSVGRE
jgi:hypothetical protein